MVVRTLAVVALFGLTLGLPEAAWSETLSAENLQLHEGEIVLSAVPFLSDDLGRPRVERSIVGGLAPGHSTAPSGLQLEASVVAVPEPSSGLLGVVAVLSVGLLAYRRNGILD